MILKIWDVGNQAWIYYDGLTNCSVSKNYEVLVTKGKIVGSCYESMENLEGEIDRVGVIPVAAFATDYREPEKDDSNHYPYTPCKGVTFDTEKEKNQLILFRDGAFLINDQGKTIDRL